jgi:hypothetical protein
VTTVADSMPELGLKSSKPHNFSTMSPNITYNDATAHWTATIHIYSLKKFQKIPNKSYNHSNLPKPTKKAVLVDIVLLGGKIVSTYIDMYKDIGV